MSPARSRTRVFLLTAGLTIGLTISAVLAAAFVLSVDDPADPAGTVTTRTARSPGPTSSPAQSTPMSSAPKRVTDMSRQSAAPRPRGRSPRPSRHPLGTTASVIATRHVFPVAGCSTSYARTHHDYPATDVFAGRGCLFVSPVAGRIDEVNRVDRWSSSTNLGADRGGLSVSIVGIDGVRYYGSHLESVLANVTTGQRVEPGSALGHIGDTGSARGVGTHLHFGLSWPTPPGYWWIRRGVVAPAPFLDAWRSGRDVSPSAAVHRERRAYGDDSRCRADC